MFPPEALFTWRIDELKQIVDNPTTANLFDSAAKLRQLLTDENPLIHQANRNLKIRLQFTVCEFWEMPEEFREGLVHHQTADAISPRLGPGGQEKTLNLAGFLKERVIEHKGQMTTVRDVIRYVANYAGAVHKGTPDSPETKALESAAMQFQMSGTSSVLYALRGIADVAIAGCEPLYQKLRA